MSDRDRLLPITIGRVEARVEDLKGALSRATAFGEELGEQSCVFVDDLRNVGAGVEAVVRAAAGQDNFAIRGGDLLARVDGATKAFVDAASAWWLNDESIFTNLRRLANGAPWSRELSCAEIRHALSLAAERGFGPVAAQFALLVLGRHSWNVG
jgi:hypothetical protein